MLDTVIDGEMTEQKKPAVYLGHIIQRDGSIGYALCESFEEAESYNAACVRNLRLLAGAIANNKEKSKG